MTSSASRPSTTARQTASWYGRNASCPNTPFSSSPSRSGGTGPRGGRGARLAPAARSAAPAAPVPAPGAPAPPEVPNVPDVPDSVPGVKPCITGVIHGFTPGTGPAGTIPAVSGPGARRKASPTTSVTYSSMPFMKVSRRPSPLCRRASSASQRPVRAGLFTESGTRAMRRIPFSVAEKAFPVRSA